jgi:hypothetical protein
MFNEPSTTNLIRFPEPDAEAHARADTERKQKLFAWADDVLLQLGLTESLAQAQSADDVRKITFDADAVDVEFAIRAALHPVHGRAREPHFTGIREGALKRILRTRFEDLKKDRVTELVQRNDNIDGGWTDDLKVDALGRPLPLLANLILLLHHHPAWKGVLGFDEFNARVVIRTRPPWRRGSTEVTDVAWTDHYESEVRVWFQNENILASLGDVGRAVQVAARLNPFHPVREYFGALTWDGTSRLDRWLVTYLRAKNTPYARAVGPRFLISVVARIYHPGCKVDHMLVLEGPQGKQKSSALRSLAVRDAWFADRLSNVTTKDAAIEMAGVMLIEVAEMDALVKATNSKIKSFITEQTDRYRPPYGRHLIDLPRQCVFAGSINPPVGGYLKDPSGSRRFWPVACGDVDRTGIERDRDQLWAEAVHHYKAGAKWWLETDALEELATIEQKARFKTDVWQEPIEKWLDTRKDTSISYSFSNPEVMTVLLRRPTI